MTELILKQVILYVSEVVLISFLCYLTVDATHKIKRLINGITIEHNKVVREKTNEQKRSEYYKRYNKCRNETASEYVKFYKSQKWVNMRAFVMAQNNWICQHCLLNDYVVHADVVDYIVPTKIDWSKD